MGLLWRALYCVEEYSLEASKSNIMQVMKAKRNKLNPQVFEKARERVKAAFPYDNVKMGFSRTTQRAQVYLVVLLKSLKPCL